MLLLYIMQGMKLPFDILVQLGQVGTLILGSLGVWVAMFNQRRQLFGACWEPLVLGSAISTRISGRPARQEPGEFRQDPQKDNREEERQGAADRVESLPTQRRQYARSSNPPSMAPGMLPMPPNTAAPNALTPGWKPMKK